MIKAYGDKETNMTQTALKEKLLRDIKDLPNKQIYEVLDFVNYLKVKEDTWFIDYVNKRGRLAKAQKKSGRKFIRLEELQREFK